MAAGIICTPRAEFSVTREVVGHGRGCSRRRKRGRSRDRVCVAQP